MVFKFINKGKREHEEMSAFIREFRTTNELLFKERNNSLSKLRFEVYGLSKVINNALISECEGKGVTTRGGKMTTQGILNENTKIRDKEPSVFVHDKLDAPKEVLVKNEPQKGKEQVVQPSIKVQTSLIPFPRRLRKEKKESQQRQFLENLKQLYINLLFIEALAQMPKLCPDNVMRRCVAGNKILEILAHCHSGPTGGHHSASITGMKVYESGFFWPSIFKDAKGYAMRSDACQRSGNIL
ncbi:hypothetical protein Tco_0653550 [Tanacetum coccineum]|uniref:Integrase zinc-binding domain-containing protein n=1 Tax=Tanacetum coccineum TaxID=301880 RepID=A0ABQ4X0Q8_9ASTR